MIKPGQHPEHRTEQTAGPRGPHHRQRRTGHAFKFGEDDLVEQVCNEVRKVIGVVVRKQDMRNTMPVDAGFDEIHQRARAEIQQHDLVGVNEIAGGGPCRMDIRAGSKDGKAHSVAAAQICRYRAPARSQPWPFSFA